MAYGNEWESIQSNQDVFDHVVGHLARQGEPSVNGSMCVYRSMDGKACAVGCLIPDSLYEQKFDELTSTSMLAEAIPGPFGDFLFKYESILARLQNAHDRKRGVDKLLDDLNEIADAFDLVFSEDQKDALRWGWKPDKHSRILLDAFSEYGLAMIGSGLLSNAIAAMERQDFTHALDNLNLAHYVFGKLNSNGRVYGSLIASIQACTPSVVVVDNSTGSPIEVFWHNTVVKAEEWLDQFGNSEKRSRREYTIVVKG